MQTKFLATLIASIALSSHCAPAWSATAAEDLASGCAEIVSRVDSKDGEPSFHGGYCLGFVVGMLDAYALAGGQIGTTARVCIPVERDAMAVVRRIAATRIEHPEAFKTAKPSAVVTVAIMQVFPCPKS